MKPTSRPNGEVAVVAKIAAAPYRAMGGCLRSSCAARRRSRTTMWYDMPGYAKDGKTVRFFCADKKYMTFGFAREATLTCDGGRVAPAH